MILTPREINVFAKKVLLRMDLDVETDYTRIERARETFNYLISNKAKVIIIGHKGRPGGKFVQELSLRPFTKIISEFIGLPVSFSNQILGERVILSISESEAGSVLLLENLRFDPREEKNDENFAKELASLAEVYINEAFAVSHRNHASIVGVPRFLPHAGGFRFVSEVFCLSKILSKPERPLIFIISGIKEDKIELIKKLLPLADKILVGGKLPEYLENPKSKIQNSKLVIARLNSDKKDITADSIEKFKQEIAKAKTIVLAGVVGRYEEEKYIQGTKLVFQAVATSHSYKIAGGGDTEAALTKFGLEDKFDWISVGGGAMLEFLVEKTLPGIKALE